MLIFGRDRLDVLNEIAGTEIDYILPGIFFLLFLFFYLLQ